MTSIRHSSEKNNIFPLNSIQIVIGPAPWNTFLHVAVTNERFPLRNSSWKSAIAKIWLNCSYRISCINCTFDKYLSGSSERILSQSSTRYSCLSLCKFFQSARSLSKTDPVSWNFKQTFLLVVLPIFRALAILQWFSPFRTCAQFAPAYQYLI